MSKRLFFTSCPLLITVLATSSCSKDDRSLVGTTWEEYKSTSTLQLTFQNKIHCQILITSTESVNAVILEFTYEYEHPNVRMYPKTSGIAELKGIIDGKTMNVINVSTGKTAYTVVKAQKINNV